MKLFGLTLFERGRQKALSPVSENRGWIPLVLESFAGAWQTNVTIDRNSVMTHHAVYACMTLIASDVAKLRIKLVQRDANRIWSEVDNFNYGVLAKPNHFQTRIQFLENWVLSKLARGNAYILMQRGESNRVVALYVLDPNRVRPLVADDGSVFYELDSDSLSKQPEQRIIVPARDIIHDRMNCLFHPLVGTSPILAAGLAATQGLNMQKQSAWFFGNRSMPGGILTAPGAISDETAARLKSAWETNFGGENAGKVAVLGDDLKFQKMPISAEESQMIEQLKWTAEMVCSVFHVPPYKIGIGQMPTYNNIQSLNVEYYSQCLQILIESAEICLDEGLGLVGERGSGPTLGTEFDLDGLLRMDSVTQMEVLDKASGILTIDEKRAKLDRPPVRGGDSVYLQRQNYSLEALAKRDAKEDPFAKSDAGTTSAVSAPPAADGAAAAKAVLDRIEALAMEIKATTAEKTIERRPADDDVTIGDLAALVGVELGSGAQFVP